MFLKINWTAVLCAVLVMFSSSHVLAAGSTNKKVISEFNNTAQGKAFNKLYPKFKSDSVRGICFADGYFDKAYKNFSCNNKKNAKNKVCKSFSSDRAKADKRWNVKTNSSCSSLLNANKGKKDKKRKDVFNRGRGSYQEGEKKAPKPNKKGSGSNLSSVAAIGAIPGASTSATPLAGSTIRGNVRARGDKDLSRVPRTRTLNCVASVFTKAEELRQLKQAVGILKNVIRTNRNVYDAGARVYGNANRALPNGELFVEYDVVTSGTARGLRRLVVRFPQVNTTNGIQYFYTNTHYDYFVQINPAGC